ncbi:MAG: FtsW/RodA/SpoVE family cell cycle protein [Hyphomicrobiaceae bacterium]
MRFDREDKSLLANWWFTVDRILLTAVFLLMGVGIIVSLAASPSVAINKDLAAFYFVKRHVIVVSFGAVLMLLLSAQSPRTIRRVALVLYMVSIGTMIYVLAAGEEINGARRWLRVGGISLQPSELAKPAFVVLSAWAFAEYERRRDVPALPVAIGLYMVFVTLLLMQPDVGQSLLITLVWGAIFVLAGLAIVWAAALISLALAGLGGAYFMLPYVQNRVHTFLFAVPGDNSQIERAFNSFKVGGFFGRGPGEGTIKTVLPDAHTDFIFAVIAEEYGVVACLALLALFMFIVFRALTQAISSEDLSMRYAVCGLALLIGGQALINMGVNVGLLPAKGMTLPLISAGGSSLMAVAITFGMMLGLTRRRQATVDAGLPGLGAGAVNSQ